MSVCLEGYVGDKTKTKALIHLGEHSIIVLYLFLLFVFLIVAAVLIYSIILNVILCVIQVDLKTLGQSSYFSVPSAG